MALEYLKRQPTSTGNRKVFTWSGWVKTTKESKAGNGNDIFFCASSNNTGSTVYHRTRIGKYVQDPHDFGLNHYDGANDNYAADPDFRDFSSWSHYLCSVDTTKEQTTDRVKIYVNGAHISDLATVTAINQYLDTFVNGLTVHYLGADGWNTSPNTIAKISMFDVFFVDGQALTPDVFGFNKDGDGYISVGSTQATDFRPGQWSPHSPRKIKTEIERKGGFGVNGFYLPMNDSSNFGADFHTTPDSIIKLKGEDLPQPQNGAPTTSDAYVSQLRSDPYAANLVLAVPGIAGGQGSGYGDYSADIKGSGTNKTTTANGNATIATTASYYGSAMDFSGNGTSSANGGTVVAASNSDFNMGTGDFTLEGWVYPDVLNQDSGVFGIGSGGTIVALSFTNGVFRYRGINSSGTVGAVFISSPTYVEQQWYHVVLERHDGVNLLYVDGVTVGVSDQSSNNINLPQGDAVIGSWSTSRTYGFDGKIQDVRFYKGVAKYKGGFDVPKPYTPVGIESWRQVSDTCKNNFATLNSIDNNGGVLSNGNLTYGDAGSDGWNNSRATIGASSGKWYWEMRVDAINQVICASVAGPSGNDSTNGARLGFLPGQTDDAGVTYYDDGRLYHADSQSSGQAGWGSMYGATDVIGIALDMDDSGGKVWFSKNGSWQASGNPSTGANPARSDLKTYANIYFPTSGTYYANTTQTFNFGQNLTFSDILGNKGNRLNSANNSWTLTSAGSQGNFTVADDGVTLSGTTASSAYMRATYTLDPKKKYIISFKYTAGANNQLALQDDKGYITTTDGTATTALQVGSHYAAVISASTSVVITATNWNTSYTVNNIHLSEYDAGYTDDSGKGKFQYQPPTGFLALCEDNLPTPTIADPGDYFKTVIYTGTGSSRAVTGVGFKPDFVWIKERNSTSSHELFNSVVGATVKLNSNTVNAESVNTGALRSFDSDGFSLGSGGAVNEDTAKTYVAWCWKAGGAAVANTDGTIPSQVSANQTAGFSIVSYTGTGSAGTVGHGLGKAPSLIITKHRAGTSVGNVNWNVSTSLVPGGYLELNTDVAHSSNADRYVTAGTNTNSFPGGYVHFNDSNRTYISYCWAEIEGFSKFGSYLGNGSTDGPFVYCGFKPAWVMVKSSSNGGTNWRIWDSSRGPTNPNNLDLLANTTHVENAHGSDEIDLLSNGFKIRSTGSWHNLSGGSYIFMAFAESPFQTANAK